LDFVTISRRFLLRLSASAPVALVSASGPVEPAGSAGNFSDWASVRELFDLSPDTIHMSAMLLASHPKPVRDAIARHRSALDSDPVEYLEDNGDRLTEASREAAARYLGVDSAHVALTDSTTMGIGLVYTSLQLRPGQEVLTSDEDYYVTHNALRYATERTGASKRRIALFDDISNARADSLVQRVAEEIRPETRLLALTWVHSSTGLKMPVPEIAAALRDINAGRDEADQVLFGLDAVHGFGVETDNFLELGVDFFLAGCHKWLFGPRGTGIAAISERGLAATRPTIPSFDDSEVFSAWYAQREPRGGNNGQRMTPGGFKPFEHRWALAEAFELHHEIGRERIASRTHDLAGALKEALTGIDGVTVHTPRENSLSSGIVAFSIDGVASSDVVSRLRGRNVIASVAPYPSSLARLTPSIRNTEAEIDRAAQSLRDSI
jgi:isopenicillin-N epimerase